MAWCSATTSCRADEGCRIMRADPIETVNSKPSGQSTTARGSTARYFDDPLKGPPSNLSTFTAQAVPWATEELNPMMKWFQEEVVNRLERLDSRLDEIVLCMEPKAKTTRKDLKTNTLECPCGDKATIQWPVDSDSFSVRTKKLDLPAASVKKYGEVCSSVGAIVKDVGIESPKSPCTAKAAEGNCGDRKPIQELVENFQSGNSKDAGDSNGPQGSESSGTSRAGSKNNGSYREAVLNFLEDAESGPIANAYAHIMPAFGMCSAFVTVLESASNPPLCGVPAAVVETAFDVAFALELLIRWSVTPAKLLFLKDGRNVIDLIGVLPLVLRLATQYTRPCHGTDESLVATILLAIVPVIRILKCVRRFEKFELILSAFKAASEALPICLFCLLLLTMTFATAIFLVEPRDNIPTLLDAMWLTIVTATTVGYGDKTPQSTAGHLIVSVLVVCSVLYLSMPLGIVGQSFTEVWQERDRVLIRRKTLDSLRTWGYTASDIPTLFDMFDTDGNRELDFVEFKKMFRLMKVGLSHDRLASLFESIDKDGGGTIDDKEFVKGLFGLQTYHDVYCTNETSEGMHSRRPSLTNALTSLWKQ